MSIFKLSKPLDEYTNFSKYATNSSEQLTNSKRLNFGESTFNASSFLELFLNKSLNEQFSNVNSVTSLSCNSPLKLKSSQSLKITVLIPRVPRNASETPTFPPRIVIESSNVLMSMS